LYIDAILAAMASCLKVGGMLFITHPLGADFVQKLHQEDPSTVPHLLPTRDELENTKLALKVVEWQQEDQEGNPIYLAGAIKVPYQQLPQVLRFRGTVDSGYGRGGKKLGFPTANLPESLFFNALENVSTGVYFGWAVVEGRNGEIHKAAVNVGYSPTFEGKENTEKIIEAHLIPDEPLEDFYGETMRLALCGFLRPEQKFDSFPDLMAAITNDVSNAKEALTVEPYASLQADSFLVNANVEWIGTSGGDATASWEFQDLSAALEEKSAV
jgi:riboflavin kinase